MLSALPSCLGVAHLRSNSPTDLAWIQKLARGARRFLARRGWAKNPNRRCFQGWMRVARSALGRRGWAKDPNRRFGCPQGWMRVAHSALERRGWAKHPNRRFGFLGRKKRPPPVSDAGGGEERSASPECLVKALKVPPISLGRDPGPDAVQQGFMVSGLHASILTERRPAGTLFPRSSLDSWGPSARLEVSCCCGFASAVSRQRSSIRVDPEPYNAHYRRRFIYCGGLSVSFVIRISRCSPRWR